MKVCVTGGAGYVGSLLVPKLLSAGHDVRVLDTFWYGDHLPRHARLRRIPGDIRKRADLKKAFKTQDAVIHLACVSNDPSFDLNPTLGRQVNYSSFLDILTIMQECHVGRFIYASSSSVYGVSDDHHVTEDSPKKPLTDYSKFKLQCENELKNFGMGGVWTIVRPATVCGHAPRMRFDLVVNILTIQAIKNKKITIFGGNQLRPNIYIHDMARAYEFILQADERDMDQKTFNVGFENLNLFQIHALIEKVLGEKIEVEIKETNDQRSYHINSDLFLSHGFETKFDIEKGIVSIIEACKKGRYANPLVNPEYYNIKKMQGLGLL